MGELQKLAGNHQQVIDDHFIKEPHDVEKALRPAGQGRGTAFEEKPRR